MLKDKEMFKFLKNFFIILQTSFPIFREIERQLKEKRAVTEWIFPRGSFDTTKIGKLCVGQNFSKWKIDRTFGSVGTLPAGPSTLSLPFSFAIPLLFALLPFLVRSRASDVTAEKLKGGKNVEKLKGSAILPLSD